MIIKKPYGFLIKNFRIIHLFLALLLIYITYKSSMIYTFFNDYVKTGHYTFYANLSSKFINYYMFLIVALIILVGVILYFLLKWKDKKRLFYILLCIFYLVGFIFFIYMFETLKDIQTTTMDMRIVRINRDLALFMTFPQYIFVVFTILRGLGFDIKKFNFSQDIADLQMDVKDTEEIELILAQDTYKYMRTIRRILREIRYIAIENRFFFIVIVSVVTIIIGLSLYLNKEVYNKVYLEKEEFIVESLNMSVEQTYLSSIDYSGNAINENKAYVIVKLNINNQDSEKQRLKTDNFRLMINEEAYYPNLSKENYFLDIGDSYFNEVILPGKSYEYLLVYEIETENIDKKLTFRILNDINPFKGEIEADYKEVDIKPIKLNEVITVAEKAMKENVNLSDSSLKESSIKINSYSLATSFTESYKYCSNNNCFDGKITIKPNLTQKFETTLMRLETEIKLNNSLFISKHLPTASDFMKYFATVNYTLDNKIKTTKVDVITSKYVKNTVVFLEVPKEIEEASNIKLYLTIRNSRYIITLK